MKTIKIKAKKSRSEIRKRRASLHHKSTSSEKSETTTRKHIKCLPSLPLQLCNIESGGRARCGCQHFPLPCASTSIYLCLFFLSLFHRYTYFTPHFFTSTKCTLHFILRHFLNLFFNLFFAPSVYLRRMLRPLM